MGLINEPTQELPLPHLHALLAMSHVSPVTQASTDAEHLQAPSLLLAALSQYDPVVISEQEAKVAVHLQTPLLGGELLSYAVASQ